MSSQETGADSQKQLVDVQTLAEIETLKNSLENEIHKKEEQLKTIVHDKYRDIVEVTDTIHNMRDHLDSVETTLNHLSEFIEDFRNTVLTEPEYVKQKVSRDHLEPNENISTPAQVDDQIDFDHDCWIVLKHINNVWSDLADKRFKECVEGLHELKQLVLDLARKTPTERQASLGKFETAVDQVRQAVTEHLTILINNSPPDQIGLMCGDDHDRLYDFCLEGALENLAKSFRDKMCEESLGPILRKSSSMYQKSILSGANISSGEQNSQKDIVQDISMDLHMFLFGLCHLLNKIAGCYLSRASLIRALRNAVEELCKIYENTLNIVDQLPLSIKRKQVLQLYFDLLYVRSLTSTAKNCDLENETVPLIEKVTSMYESRLDTMELYIISTQMQTNLANVCQRNLRLFGFLAPYS